MADLLDIAPATAVEAVHIGEQRVTVRGVSINAMAAIIARFPDLKALAGGGDGGDLVLRLVSGFGMAVGPIIAAGCGHAGEEAYEQRGASLLPEHQLKLLRAILGLTFPNGIGSFIAEVTSLIGGAGEGAKTVKVRLRKSPSPSPASSDAASPQTMQ